MTVAAPAPIEHSYEPPLPQAEVRYFLDRVNTRGAYMPDDDGDMVWWCGVLHYLGAEAIPERFREMVWQEEIALCSDPVMGFAYFLRWYGMVRIKGGHERGWQRMFPGGEPRRSEETDRSWAWQLLLSEAAPSYDIFFILKARQIGLTFYAANWAVWKAVFFNDSVGVVICNRKPTAFMIVRRIRSVYQALPDRIKRHAIMTGDGVSLLQFANGSTIEPSVTGRSEAASFVIIDEMAFLRPITKQEEVWSGIEACADNGGQILILTTANGIGDMVHTWTVDSMMGDAQHVLNANPDETVEIMYGDAELGFVFLPYYLEPTRDRAWREKKRKLYRGSLAKFDQEYPETIEQAFIASGNNFFSITHVEEMACSMKGKAEERDVRGSLIWEDKSSLKVRFVEDPYGHVVIHGIEDFAAALSSGRPFVIPADCAGDNSWGDFNTGSAIHVGYPYIDDGETMLAPPGVFVPHRELVTIHGVEFSDEFAEQLIRLGYLCNTAVIAPEANGVGTSVISYLRRNRYPRIYRRRSSDTSKTVKITDMLGWWTNQKSKNIACGLLDKYIRNSAIEIRDIDAFMELRNTLHLGDGRIGAQEPNHDDRMMRLAIGCGILGGAARSWRIKASEPDNDDPIMQVLAEIEAEVLGRSGVSVGNEKVSMMG